jgi:hypothetical protein
MSPVLELRRGGDLLGVLSYVGTDMPMFIYRFEPTLRFSEVQPLFDEELRLLNADEMDAWESAYDKINALGLTLEPTDGGPPIREFILHIEGREAWFRA